MSKRDRHIILETPRLALRQFTEDDVDNLFDLNSDPEVMRYLTGGTPTTRAKIRDEIIPFYLDAYQRFDRLGAWAAESAASGEFLGWFHFRPGPRHRAVVVPRRALRDRDRVRESAGPRLPPPVLRPRLGTAQVVIW